MESIVLTHKCVRRCDTACLIFGFARSGSAALIQHMGMPSSYNDLVRILPYVLTLLLLMFFSWHYHSPGLWARSTTRGNGNWDGRIQRNRSVWRAT